MGRPDRNTLDKPTKKTCIKDFFNHINAVWSRGAQLFLTIRFVTAAWLSGGYYASSCLRRYARSLAE